MTMTCPFARFVLAATLALGLWLHFPVVPALAGDSEVKISNFTFSPQQLTVKAGTTVTWTNEDDIPHTIVSTPSIRSKPLDSEEKFSFTFTTPGTY